MIQTVLGPAEPAAGLVDAHCHLHVDPDLDDDDAAARELAAFGAAGGTLVVDCQPGGAGRDGGALARISRAAGVHVVAATGFHLRRHHGGGAPWSDPGAAGERFARELGEGLQEAPAVRAGVVKTAWTGTDPDEAELLRAAVAAARAHDRAIVVHTEPEGPLEGLLDALRDAGRVQLSHVDKRPDAGLHRELAAAGLVLGYDTFLRPKYGDRVWPLLEAMLADGLDGQITVGLDLVDVGAWHVGGGPGLRAIADAVIPRLRALGASDAAIARLTGGTARRLLG